MAFWRPASIHIRPMKRKIIRWGAVTTIALMVAAVCVSWLVAGVLVAPARKTIGHPPDDFPAQAIRLQSDSGATISGWHLRSGIASGAEVQPVAAPIDGDTASNGVIVLLHGIHANRLSMLERGRDLFRRGFSVVMIDFRAHGESSGDMITIGHLEKHDVVAAVEYARGQHPGEPIGVIGVSLGGASALLASPLSIDALVLESVYPNIQAAVENRVEARLGPLAPVPSTLLLWQLGPRMGITVDDLRPIDCLSRVDCPVLIASGINDVHTTASETRLMFSRASAPKQLWMVPELGHEDLCHGAGEDYRKHVFGFLERELVGEKRSAHSRQ